MYRPKCGQNAAKGQNQASTNPSRDGPMKTKCGQKTRNGRLWNPAIVSNNISMRNQYYFDRNVAASVQQGPAKRLIHSKIMARQGSLWAF